jgi:hypothetical protein
MCCKIWYHVGEAWNLFDVSRYIVTSSRFHVSVITNYYLCGCMLEPNLTKGIPFGYLDFATNSMMHIQRLISPDMANMVTIKQLLCHYLFDKLCKTLNDATTWIHGPSFWDIQRSYHNLENLAQRVQEVEILVGDCCDAWWIQVAMILANVKEHFASLAFKLSLYLQLLENNFNERVKTMFLSELWDQKWSDDVKHEEFHFDEEAKEDRQLLISRLIQIGSSDSENLTKRWEISSNLATLLWYNVQKYSMSANWSSRKGSICNCAQSSVAWKTFCRNFF